MTRIVQISDTHLSPGKSHFASNWAPVAAFVREQRPDIVVHTGDVTVDGADVEADFAHCASLFAELDAPVHAVPGNHASHAGAGILGTTGGRSTSTAGA
jgi:3',5'-cyclic AMP phosphodiesterase CpdA